MGRKHDMERLREAARIRDLQRTAAEAAAAHAGQVLREKQAAKIEQERACRAAEADWHAFLAAPRLRFETMAMFRGALIRGDDQVRRAAADVDNASSILMHRAELWRTAIHRHDAAQDLVRKMERRRARRGEEEALQDGSDLILQRWMRR
ncbi:MAG: hypothetical protein WDN01_14250 [Rhizomicrobium sp.]